MEILLLFAGGMFMMLLLGGRPASARAQASAGAQRVRGELDAVYGGEHEFAPAQPGDFPDAEHGFYEAAAGELGRRGYVRLGDLEDLTMTRAYPAMRTYMRVFVDDGQLIRASVFHMRTRGVMIGLLQIIRAAPSNLRLIELVTESSTGHFLVTSNTRGLDRLTAPPGMHVERLDPSTRPGAMAARHVERLREWLRVHPGYSPVGMATMEDALASMQRSIVMVSLHRAAIGGLSRDELERIKGGPLSALDEEFLAQVQHPPRG